MVKMPTGKPQLRLRLTQEVFDLLTERAEEVFGPSVRGSSGGASRLARAFIYVGLGLEPPMEWGEKHPARNAKLREKRAAQKAASAGADQESAP